MADAGVVRFIEFGPGNVLTGLVKRIVASAETANIAAPTDIRGAE
jgi:malonyl CoA-acyl carrier protein transacylase